MADEAAPPPYEEPIELSQRQSEGRQVQAIYCPPRKVSLVKLGLRTSAVVNSLLLLGLSIGIATFGSRDVGPIIWYGVVCGIGLIWSISDLCCYFSRKGRRSANPGASVALDLLLWMPLLALSCIQVYGPYGYYDDESDRYIAKAQSIWTATAAFGFIQFGLHFILFVIACFETNRRRAYEREPVTFVEMGPNGSILLYLPANFKVAQINQDDKLYNLQLAECQTYETRV